MSVQVPDKMAEEIRREAESEGITTDAILEAAWRRYRAVLQRKKIHQEQTWWESLPLERRMQYKGEYVAVHNKEVVDHDIDRVSLHKRVRVRYGNIAVLVIPAEGPREINVVSFHLEN